MIEIKTLYDKDILLIDFDSWDTNQGENNTNMKVKLTLSYFIAFLFFSLNVLAQISPLTIIGIGTEVGRSIFSGIKDKRKSKNIQNSISNVEINGSIVSILRVKEDKIISDAKIYIVKIQNELEEYYTSYKNNQHINRNYYFEDVTIVQNMDKNWPTDYYEKELAAYRKYENALMQREKIIRDSLATIARIEGRRIEDSLAIVRYRIQDSLAAIKKNYNDSLSYINRVKGYYFINKDVVSLFETPSEKSKVKGKIYLGSYIKIVAYLNNSQFVKIMLDGLDGYLDKNDLVDSIDKITFNTADIKTYKSRYYYKYEPNYSYSPTEIQSYTSPFFKKADVNNSTYASNYQKTNTQKVKINSAHKQSHSQRTQYILGPRGGCYYLTSSGTKVYVDHSYCR